MTKSEQDELLTLRFQDGIKIYMDICGEDPTVCIMGRNEYLCFEDMARRKCTVVMKESEPEFGRTQWLGIDIFQGDFPVGIRFGR